MANSKKPKKRYNPDKYKNKPLSPFLGPNTVVRTPISSKQHMQLKTWPHLALLALEEGKGTPDDWETVRFRVIVARLIAEQYYTRESVLPIRECEDKLKIDYTNFAHDRWKPGKLDPLRSGEVGEVLVVADEMQSWVNRELQIKMYQKALKIVREPVLLLPPPAPLPEVDSVSLEKLITDTFKEIQ